MTRPSLARSVLSNWAVTVLGVTYSLFITPIVVKGLNKELYGVWSFLNGLMAYSDLLYMGLGGALIRYVAKYMALNDHAAVRRLASVVLSIYGALGTLCLLVALGMSRSVPHLFTEPLTGAAAMASTYACALLGVQVFCVFIASGFNGLLMGQDRFDLINMSRGLTIAARFVVVPFAVHGNYPLLNLAVVTAASMAAEMIICGFLAFRVTRGLRIMPTVPTSAELRLLYGFGVQCFVIILAGKLISYTDTTVIGVMLGASSVALYVLPMQLIDYIRLLLGGFTGVFLPRLTVLSMHQDVEGLRRAYIVGVRIACFLGAFLITNLLFLGVPFLTLWVGSDFGEPARWVIVFLGTAAFLQIFNYLVPLPFFQAMHLMSFPAKTLLAEGALNLALTIVLAREFGISGVAAATAIATLVVSFVLIPRYLCRQLSISFRALVLEGLWPSGLVVGFVSATHWLLSGMMPATSYGALFIRVAATAPMALAVLLLSASAYERDVLAGKVASWKSASRNWSFGWRTPLDQTIPSEATAHRGRWSRKSAGG